MLNLGSRVVVIEFDLLAFAGNIVDCGTKCRHHVHILVNADCFTVPNHMGTVKSLCRLLNFESQFVPPVVPLLFTPLLSALST